MPVKDVDGGIIWRGYNPRILSERLPKEQYVSKPFYFGGSNVPTDLGLPKSSYSGTGMSVSTTEYRYSGKQTRPKFPLLRK